MSGNLFVALVNLALGLANLGFASWYVHIERYGMATFNSGIALLAGGIFLVLVNSMK